MPSPITNRLLPTTFIATLVTLAKGAPSPKPPAPSPGCSAGLVADRPG
jgi:hypothetical protein